MLDALFLFSNFPSGLMSLPLPTYLSVCLQVPQFLDALAGRAATVEDVCAYEAALAAHCRRAGRRAVLMALAPHGLTERRLRRLVGAYEARFPAVRELRGQWEDFFSGPKYRKTIRLGVGCGDVGLLRLGGLS